MKQKTINFIKQNAVCVIAFSLALISAIIVPPDKQYSEYFDVRTLSCLFLTLTVVCALKNINFFYNSALKILDKFKNFKTCVFVLICITFIGSMLLANDMALITFLPLGYYIVTLSKNEKSMAVVFILQNIAANLGGMLTPFGNPQNLYLYSFYDIPTGEFMLTMLPSFLISITLIFLCCFIFIKNGNVQIEPVKEKLINKRSSVYFILFALAISIVFKLVPYWLGLLIIPFIIFLMDKKALLKVDYGLLMTFVFFFIFAGNVARIELIKTFMSSLLNKNTLLISSLCCQFISNVPSSILLSQFTDNWKELLIGVNIGGCGTLIASLASLITFREYVSHNPDKKLKYLGIFSAFNFSFLFILIGVNYLLCR